MATLRKRKLKNGKEVYLIDFRFHGKRIIRSTKTDDPKTAKLILKDIEARIAKNTFRVEEINPQKKVYLKQFIKEYLEYSQTNKAKKTFLADKLSLNLFIKFAGDRTLSSIDRKLIDQYLNIRAREVKKSSVNVELRHLKSAFTKAIQWEYVAENPFKEVKTFKIPKSAPHFLSEDEINKLIDGIEEQWLKEIVIFDLNTGLRIQELVNLRWDDVDLDNLVIKVSNQIDFTTKSKKERIIPICDEVYNLLQRITKYDVYVFSKSDGNRRGTDYISKMFKKYIRRMGLNEEYTFHTLRHTFASHLVQKGTSLYFVAELLGHSNIEVTKIYAHLVPENLHSVVNLLNFGAKEKPKSKMAVVRGKKIDYEKSTFPEAKQQIKDQDTQRYGYSICQGT